MRAFINAILSFIGAASLSDNEFNSLDPSLDTTNAQEVYEALSPILVARAAPSDFATRLQYYYRAKGYDFSDNKIVHSQILVGGEL